MEDGSIYTFFVVSDDLYCYCPSGKAACFYLLVNQTNPTG